MSLLAFSFVTHPVGYCFLLLGSAFRVALYSYLVLGFRWYVVLFCLVYVGGVYVLFIFVSLHKPKPTSSFRGGVVSLAVSYLVFLFVLFGIDKIRVRGGYFMDCSHYLCTYFEGFSYLFFCLILMLGFVVIRVVTRDKDSFFR